MDEAQYCKALVNRFLEKAGAKKKPRFHSTILPAEFVPSVEDCSKNEETVKTMQEGYGIDFSSFVGVLLYLSYARPDITYALVKFAKYTRCPEVVHMEALLHLLRYLKDNMNLGLKFYSDITMKPSLDCCQAMKFLWKILYAHSLINLGMMILIQAGAQDAV